MAIKQIIRNNFGVKQHSFPVPNLNSMQMDSYKSFWEELPLILQEFSPITDPAGNRYKIDLGPDYFIEQPERNAQEAIMESKSFNASLYINVTVENLLTKEKKTQRVFAGKVPAMTDKGNFIINGIQKIVVSQLVKSPGLLFTKDFEKGMPIYTAKIIPNRGVWMDISNSPEGVIYVKIDRKKKFPVTQLLKLLGIEKEDFAEYVKSVDIDPKMNYAQNTIEKDPALGIEDCVSSIYKKIRPGDIVSIEQGRKYLISLLTDRGRYDMGKVGRYKFEMRLRMNPAFDFQDYQRNITGQDILACVKELIRMTVEGQEGDNIDSLSNRRVRAVGEWMGNTFRAGISRVVKNTKDKMITSEDTDFTPAKLVNMRPLTAMIDDFFNTSQLSRYMDHTNLLSEMDQRQFMTCSGPGGLTKERASMDARDVQASYYGRICPVNTPESSSVGLNLHAAMYSRVNKMGFLETPYRIVKASCKVTDPDLIGRTNIEEITFGKKTIKKNQLMTKDKIDELTQAKFEDSIAVKQFVSDEIIWLSSDEENFYIISEHTSQLDDMGHFLVEAIGARKIGEPLQVLVTEVTLMDVTPNQILSLSTSMVPFISQTDGLRVLMGTNQQGQALPLIKPENPVIATGLETVAAKDSGYVTMAPEDGKVTFADGSKVIMESKTGKSYEYTPLKYLPSNQHSSINQQVVVKPGEIVKKGDFLIEGFGIHNGEFAIGQNVKVAFMPFKGYNFEDAIVLSEKLIQQDKFTSTHIYELTCDVHETRIGKEEVTRDIPNVQTDKLAKLDKNGIISIGSYVESGDILVGKITPKGEIDLSAEDKLIRVLFGEYSRDVKDSSLYLEHGLAGKVTRIKVFDRAKGDALPNDVLQRVHIWLATTRKIRPGDKMAGRHGNKGVVSVIMPVENMPYTANGEPVDIVLNPLGVIGRMNLGQLLETHLGLVCKSNDEFGVTQPLNDLKIETIYELLVKNGFRADGKVDLWDGETGEKYDRPVVVGSLYFNKLHHLVDDKIHARSTGPYSLVTQQPLGGRSHSGGQRFGEMEVWALEAYGAAYALQEMLTIKSDDVKGRDTTFEAIIKEKPIVSPNLPSSFIVLANELTSLGIKVNAKVTQVATDQDKKAKANAKLALFADSGDLK
jgi:DNA-directed RNA polymerase subunit beta